MIKPRIQTELLTENDKITSVCIKDTVKKIGRSGYVSLPKALVGKYVIINVKVIQDDTGRKK